MTGSGKTSKHRESGPSEPDLQAIARSSLSALLGFRLRRAETTMHRDFIRSLKPTDLTQKQLAVLVLVEENPGLSQIDLCALLGVDPNTMMAFVDRLSDRDLVRRVRSRIDRRKVELHPTADGLAILDQALALVRLHEERFRSRFTPSEQEQFMDFLDRISN